MSSIDCKRKFLLAAGISVATLSGCETLVPVEVHDSAAPAFNVVLINRPEEMRYGSGKAGRGGIEFAYERYRGEGTQDLGFGSFLSLDDGRVTGPQRVNTTANVHHGHIAYNHLFAFGKHFELEPALGVSFDKFKATAQGTLPGSRELRIDGDKWGGVLAVTPRWNFNKYLGIEVRLSESGDFKNTDISASNIAFVISPNSHVLLKAGYYSRGHEFETPSEHSNVETNLHGFSGGMTIIF